MGCPRDSHHERVARYYKQHCARDGAAVTSDYVLDETISHLFRRRPFDQAVRFVDNLYASSRKGFLLIERVTPERFDLAWNLRVRFADKRRISFTDLTSMIVMTELGLTDILTEDAHFTHVGLGFRTVP